MWLTEVLHRRDTSASDSLSTRVRCAIERIDRAAAEIDSALADIRHTSPGDDQ